MKVRKCKKYFLFQVNHLFKHLSNFKYLEPKPLHHFLCFCSLSAFPYLKVSFFLSGLGLCTIQKDD